MFSTKTLVAALSVLSLAGTSLAAPAAPAKPSKMTRSNYDEGATITLIDATEHEYVVVAAANNEYQYTGVEQSISHVQVDNYGPGYCYLYGIDDLTITIPTGYTYQDVGPPQVIYSVLCESS